MINSREKRIAHAGFVGPALLIYLLIIVFPVGMSFVLGFTNWKGYGPLNFIGFDNYIRMFKDPIFLMGIKNNLWIMLISVCGQIPLGLILAYMLHRKMVKGSKIFEIMIFLPITISSIIVALMWFRIFSPIGIFPYIVRKITGNPEYVVKIFENKNWAIIPILFVLLWQHTSLYMVIFLANLQRIPNAIIEAAVIDGAKETDIFLKVVAPQLAGVIFINSIFAISGSFKSFDLIYAMTGGGPAHYTEVIGIYMYNNTFVYQNYGFGAAISIVMVLFSVIVIAISKLLLKRYEY